MVEHEGRGVAHGSRDTSAQSLGWLAMSSSLTSLIGRAHQTAQCSAQLLDPSIRLLVLTGPGGVGKTRLSIAVAEVAASSFADGVRLVNLAPVRDSQGFIPSLAREVGLREFGSRQINDLLIEWVHTRNVLLVLDNFEQILPAAVQLAELLAAGPGVKALVTSRAPLNISGEHIYTVPPLSLRSEGGASDPADAALLFSQHARAVHPEFELNAESRPIVEDICQKLDGLPLAIELAASRLRHLPLEALARMLSQPLSILVNGRRDQPGRLQTMRSAIAWSYNLLREHEQYLFRQLSVFPSGFRLDAATWVTGTSDEATTLRSLTDLIDNSLLRMTPEPDGTPRYSMLEVIREFGLEQLRATGEFDSASQRMAEWCEDLVTRGHDTLMRREKDLPWLNRYDRELDTFRHALQWTEAEGQYERMLQIAGGIGFYWYSRFLWSEGSSWLSCALDHCAEEPGASRIHAIGHFWLAVLRHYQGHDVEAKPLLDRTLMGAVLINDDLLRGGALLISGVVEEDQGHYDAALESLDQALVYFRQIENHANEALTLFHIGVCLQGQGKSDDSMAITRRALDVVARSEDRWCEAICLAALSRLCAEQGKLQDSLSFIRQVRKLQSEYKVPVLSGETLLVIGLYASISTEFGQYELAGKLFALERRIRLSVGNPRKYPEKVEFELAEQKVRAALGEAEFARISASARDLSIQDGLELILSFSHEPKLTDDIESPVWPRTVEQLTPRELEVLQLVSEGLTNPAIADQLFISRGTVRIHVSNILGKLGASTRTEAVRVAQRQGLVSTL